MTTDEQLIEQIKRGEREAYGQLFSKYYERIYFIPIISFDQTFLS